jgi:hypothetical protein
VLQNDIFCYDNMRIKSFITVQHYVIIQARFKLYNLFGYVVISESNAWYSIQLSTSTIYGS